MIAIGVLIGVGVIGIVFVAHYFGAETRIKRKLKKAPRVAISDFPDGGSGRIVGRIEYAMQPLQSPLTGRHCAYFEATVQELRRRGKHSSWVEVIREVGGVPFFLNDGTGRALVDPGMAKVAVDKDAKTKSGTFDNATPMEEAFLARHGRQSKGWVMNKSLRYYEGILELGEEVAAYGGGVFEPDPEAHAAGAQGYRGLPPQRLRMRSSGSEQLYLSDNKSTVT